MKVESTITLRFSFAILQGYSLKSARALRNFAYHASYFFYERILPDIVVDYTVW